MSDATDSGRERLGRILARRDWQLLHGERLALEGILGLLRPSVAIEIGTAQGGSLERIAAHSAEVHAIDLTGERLRSIPENAELHLGDSREVLPRLLAELRGQGKRVDLALVDGDHSAAGVRADLEALLDSQAFGPGLILLHDSFNPEVRAGIEAADPASRPGVGAVELDLVAGRVVESGLVAGQAWGGLAAVVVGDEIAAGTLGAIEFTLGPEGSAPLEFRPATAGPGTAGEGRSREELEAQLERVQSSLSWRLTAPLRALRGRR
ncbi:MAG TPA: class I SAM-dependent methyltransferase [Solirubrobacterales bacterium]|nr:class I SAM-dependent methyltransferase [Solirubrobacterales bacterium]